MRILIVSNMYPSKKCPYYGIFVKKFVDQLSYIDINYSLSVMKCAKNRILKFFGYAFFYLKTLLKIIFCHYDLIYIHYASHSSLPVLWANRIKKLKIFTNVHGSDVVPDNIKQEKYQKYTKQILSKSERIIVPSEYFKNYVAEKYNLIKEKIFIYPSAGIDKNIFNQFTQIDVDNLELKYGLDKNKKTFSFVGRLIEGKGWDVFLRAVDILNKQNVSANYIIVGSGPDNEKFELLANKLNIAENFIRFPLMTQNQLAEIYNISDAFIFPTCREGESLGLVAIEAMACGTPVICSDYAAPKFYVINNYNGYKFEKGNVEQLAEKMMEIVSLSKEDYQSLVDGAVQTSLNYESEKLYQILQNILTYND